MDGTESQTLRPRPKLTFTPRAKRDIDDCLDFVSRQPWGRCADRERDIYQGSNEICLFPCGNKVSAIRPTTGVKLRRHNIAQFAIIYFYAAPNAKYPRGLVSIRAVRHRRVENVFTGVREPGALDILVEVASC